MYQWQAVMAVAVMCGVAPIYASAWLVVQALMCEERYPRGARQWMDALFYKEYQEFCRVFFQLYTGSKFVYHGDKPRGENVLYIANHQCTIDWMIVPFMAAQASRIGHVHYVLKNTLRLMLWYGWYFEQHGCVYVRKNFEKDQNNIRRELQNLSKRSTPMWLAIFPEGTRFSTTNVVSLEASKKFASTHGLAPLQHVLFPRVKGFSVCANELRNTVDAVYDVTVAYQWRNKKGYAPTPSMADLMAGECPVVHIYTRRLPMTDIPSDDKSIAEWLYKRFAEKDRLLEACYRDMDDTDATRNTIEKLTAAVTDSSDARAAYGEGWLHRPSHLITALRLIGWSTIIGTALFTSVGRRAYVLSSTVTGLGGLAIMAFYL